MQKKIICIECPKGCNLDIKIDSGKIIAILGNQCKRGETYAREEILHPTRTLTATIIAKGLVNQLVPVKTSLPIPKNKLMEAMAVIHKMKILHPVKTGDIILKNFLGLSVDLVATRPNPTNNDKTN